MLLIVQIIVNYDKSGCYLGNLNFKFLSNLCDSRPDLPLSSSHCRLNFCLRCKLINLGSVNLVSYDENSLCVIFLTTYCQSCCSMASKAAPKPFFSFKSRH